MDVPTDLEAVIFDQAAWLLEKAWDRQQKVPLREFDIWLVEKGA